MLQIIVEEGASIPADSTLICDYTTPHEFETFKEVIRTNNLGIADEVEDEKDEFGESSKPKHGHAILACDQSAITGESLAVDKFMADHLYYTTGCKRGKAYALVTVSAKQSFVGKTATLVQGAEDQGHFKAIMNSIGVSIHERIICCSN